MDDGHTTRDKTTTNSNTAVRVASRLATPASSPPAARSRMPQPVSTVWMLGCSGGVGTTTVATLTGAGRDGKTRLTHPIKANDAIVLVCGTTATQLAAASQTINTWLTRPGQSPVIGMIAVASYPMRRREPPIVAERLGAIATWVPRLWRIPWLAELAFARDPRYAAGHPAFAAIATGITHHLKNRHTTTA